jgi:hypothetical protein
MRAAAGDVPHLPRMRFALFCAHAARLDAVVEIAEPKLQCALMNPQWVRLLQWPPSHCG